MTEKEKKVAKWVVPFKTNAGKNTGTLERKLSWRKQLTCFLKNCVASLFTFSEKYLNICQFRF